ncbi:hypothetical protein QUW59_09755 [Phocaeicola salanitronis]|jgi:hypothetical protein|nr:hypothetical protein [Phocaeicola salanitronis]
MQAKVAFIFSILRIKPENKRRDAKAQRINLEKAKLTENKKPATFASSKK